MKCHRMQASGFGSRDRTEPESSPIQTTGRKTCCATLLHRWGQFSGPLGLTPKVEWTQHRCQRSHREAWRLRAQAPGPPMTGGDSGGPSLRAPVPHSTASNIKDGKGGGLEANCWSSLCMALAAHGSVPGPLALRAYITV